MICVLEVMKTYHEVTVPESGTLLAFWLRWRLRRYGQVIARIDPRST